MSVPFEEIARSELGAALSRRELLDRAGRLGLAAVIASAVPAAELVAPRPALAQEIDIDGTLQAFYDTIIPGRKVERTISGAAIHRAAIAGVDGEPGAVEADALALGRDPRLGFNLLEPVILAELQTRSLAVGNTFLSLGYEQRERVLVSAYDFANPTRVIWEAGAAIPFTAFCASALLVEPRKRDAPGYRVMDHRGRAPAGYRNYSYRRRLNRGRTGNGNLR